MPAAAAQNADIPSRIQPCLVEIETAELDEKALREENLELQKKLIRLETELEEGKKRS